MGYIDLKIDVEKQRTPKPMDSVKKRSTSEIESAGTKSRKIIVKDHGEDRNMDLELYWAAADDDSNLVSMLKTRVIAEKEQSLSSILEQVTLTGNSMLHISASRGNDYNVAFIASHCRPLLVKPNFEGDTPLHLAAKAGFINTVQTIITLWDNSEESKKDCLDLPSASDDVIHSKRDEDLGNSPLRLRNDKGNVPLHEALLHGHSDVANYLVSLDLQVCFYLNTEGESSLYLAAMARYVKVVANILHVKYSEEENTDGRFEGKSAMHAAVYKRDQGVLEDLLHHEPKFIRLRDGEGRTPLHLAASLGYLEEVKYLVGVRSEILFVRDNKGLLPIHLASGKGHIDIVRLFLQYWPEPEEFLSSKGQNILHVAAKNGREAMVSYILGTPELEKLVNTRDKEGNTPLHLATMSWQPKIVSILTWDKRVDLKVANKRGKTALDCAEYYMETIPSFRMRLTWAALISGGVPRAQSLNILKNEENKFKYKSTKTNRPSMENYKDRVNTLLLVATLVATITFAAGFTMPGGYNSSDPDQGMATMLKNRWFHLFVFCDFIAMYCSIIVAVALIWAQLGDLNLVLTAFEIAMPLLGISLSMMSFAFFAGVYLVVSKLRWLAIAVLVTGSVFLAVLVTLVSFLCLPFYSNRRVFRYMTYYPFCLLVFVTKSYN